MFPRYGKRHPMQLRIQSVKNLRKSFENFEPHNAKAGCCGLDITYSLAFALNFDQRTRDYHSPELSDAEGIQRRVPLQRVESENGSMRAHCGAAATASFNPLNDCLPISGGADRLSELEHQVVRSRRRFNSVSSYSGFMLKVLSVRHEFVAFSPLSLASSRTLSLANNR